MPHQDHHHHPNYNRAFAIGVILNLLFVVLEFGYGVFADALALIADAGHNLSDVVSLLLAWGASLLAARTATERRTYGFRKATIMASLASAILLFVALGGIAWEALERFSDPGPVKGQTVIIVAAAGVVINSLTALLFIKGQKQDLNIRGAFLHMAADAGVSLGVVVAGICILASGQLWIDPAVSLVIVVIVLIGTWRLLTDSLNYAMDAVPKSVDVAGIKRYLNGFERVERIHDLHIWPLSTTEIALTAHLMITDNRVDNAFLREIEDYLHGHFRIAHTTLQVETTTAEASCRLDPHGNNVSGKKTGCP